MAFAVDYRCKPGTPVVASRRGIVWATREDSNSGCDDPSCIDDGNYVVIDHGDGTFSEYHHLQQFGAIAEVGEQVCRGELIGLCGNTGYSTGPHLHFALSDITHRTVPARISPAGGGRFPFAIPERTYRSKNERQSTCRKTDYSTLPTDAFAHQGIILDERLPMVIRPGQTRSKLSGTYWGDHPNIALHRKSSADGEWTDECLAVQEDGRFRAEIQWPDQKTDSGFYWFMVTGADEECLSPGWAWSYKLQVL
jgi:murein DD-endopeptidase MepM/ murein hydrolase activator NlpD